MEENAMEPLTVGQGATIDAWMAMIVDWTSHPEIGLRFMNQLHAAVLETFVDLLGSPHATLQAAMLLMTVEAFGTHPALTTTDATNPVDYNRI